MTSQDPDAGSHRGAEERDLRTLSRPAGARPAHPSYDPAPRHGPEPPPPVRLPPVWPGDEEKEWFRRERGLPPLQRNSPSRGPSEDFPTAGAPPSTRARAWAVSYGIPAFLFFVVPFLAQGEFVNFLFMLGGVALLANIAFFFRGQDLGAAVFKIRVLRENGDVAGFFHMWSRAAASAVSLLALAAGFRSALSDTDHRTWHDKWLRTYVVDDSDEYRSRTRSNSDAAFNWFWISLPICILFVVLPVVYGILLLFGGSSPEP